MPRATRSDAGYSTKRSNIESLLLVMSSLAEVFIFDAIRTPLGRGKATGKLHTQTPVSLVSSLLRQLARRYPPVQQATDEVILGCCEQYNDQGGNLARSSALQAGYRVTTPGFMVSRFCGSGLDAVNTAAAKVMSGQADLIIAGGVEMLSLFSIFGAGGPMISDVTFKDANVQIPQGLSADLIATLQGYSRNDVDALGARSQQLAADAWRKGFFTDLVPPLHNENGDPILVRDELLRDNVTAESLGKLSPAFERIGEDYRHYLRFRYPGISRIRHVHHAGNSSGIADGAAVVLIGNGRIGEELGLRPLAKIVSTASAADDPCIMLTAPAAAAGKALQRAGLVAGDVDLFEVNEAFASVVLYFMDKTNVPLDRINVAGGAIAMGHPVGATGAALTGTLVHQMRSRGLEHGVVTMCTGLGMGVATVLQRV
ncbi:MAG: acetyl-CoA C-acetyltransferase [Verrucomicrobiota bacterium]|jgi:acetyl-CoA C-acetyltransferase|nr:acetyl-CoA C-acetyltransferase [Verrucomicrobiota bacterium]